MKKKERVKNNRYFNQIINEGSSIKNEFYIIYRKEKEQILPQFGVAVGKKIGNAVVRNKLKRQIRSIIDHNKDLFESRFDYIIVMKKYCYKQNYEILENNLIKLITKKELK